MKRPRTLQHEKRGQAILLNAQGVTQRKIATQLGVSASTINRVIRESSDIVQAVEQSISDRLLTEIEKNIKVEERGSIYAELARGAKNEAVRLGTLTRIDDLQGIVTERERMRIDKQTAPPQLQPMFTLPAGTSINITVNTQDSDVINVTPRREKTNTSTEE